MNCDSLACNSPPVRGCCVGNRGGGGGGRVNLAGREASAEDFVREKTQRRRCCGHDRIAGLCLPKSIWTDIVTRRVFNANSIPPSCAISRSACVGDSMVVDFTSVDIEHRNHI